MSNTQEVIKSVISELQNMLIAKNEAYGDSAIDPIRIFATSSPIEQINVRIDDKLSRIARGHAAGEDAEWDLIGYLILKRVAVRIAVGAAYESAQNANVAKL